MQALLQVGATGFLQGSDCRRPLPLSAGAVSKPTHRREKIKRQRLGALQTLAVAALGLCASSALAQTWSTVDDFQYTAGIDTYVTGLAKDPSGTIIYAAGYAGDASGVYHAVAMKSTDAGMSWLLMDDYTDSASPPVSGYGAGYDGGITVDPLGNIFASGLDDNVSGTTGFTRRSGDGGMSWSTVDTWPTDATPAALAADSAGNIYVVGGSSAWVVRKGTGGSSWSTVDQVSNQNGTCQAWGVFCHPTAGVFVVGRTAVPAKHGSGVQQGWTVRRSRDGGATWATVDFYSNAGSLAKGVGADANGNIYVVGRDLVTYREHFYTTWLVRKSTDGGNSWVQADNYGSPAAGQGAVATAFACDASGNLFVAGAIGTSATGNQWLVRESAGGTGSWQNVDTFQYAPGQYAEAVAVLGDSARNAFVAGQAHDAGGSLHWIIRKR